MADRTNLSRNARGECVGVYILDATLQVFKSDNVLIAQSSEVIKITMILNKSHHHRAIDLLSDLLFISESKSS